MDEPPIRFRPEVSRSTTPVVGRPVTAVKRRLLRLLGQPLDDMAAQASAAVGQAGGDARAALASAREGRDWAEAALAAEAAAREATQADVVTLLRRIESVEQALDRLQLPPRLARLERARRQEGVAPAPSAPAPAPGGASAADPPLDYLAFEARFRGSEETIRDRQTAYRALLADRRRVVDLGCGRGELVQLLVDAGVDAYGVELNADFVELVAEKGLEVVRQDLLQHVEGLAPGDVDAIVASHVVEHLPPAVVSRLVATAFDRLPDGGLLVLETPNPESLVAGSVNFHRDPTHVRPVHPETLAFICDSAGFASTEILRLSPVPDAERLPMAGPGGGALGEHLDRVVARLNDLLYGFQDYAVAARR